MYNPKIRGKKNLPSHVLNSRFLPVTTVVLVGEAFQISLHMNIITIKIKKYLFGKRHENPEIPSLSFSSITNVFCSVLMGRMGLSLGAQLLYSWRDGREAYS